MKKKINKLLIVGLGAAGRRFLRIVKEVYPEIEIIALRHKDYRNPNDLDFQDINVVTSSIEQVIKMRPEAAIIANPASKHIEIAKILATNEIDLLIEKPISDSLEGVQELIEICQKNKVVLMTGYNLRFKPSLQIFRDLIISKKIGSVFSIRSEVGQFLPDWRPNFDYKNTVSAKKTLGGGVLLELSHEIDYLTWIFGRVDWVKSHVSKLSNLEIDVEDNALITIGFEEKNSQTIIAQLNMDFFRHDKTRRCYVIGNEGTLLWDGIADTVELYNKDEQKWEMIYSSNLTADFSYIEELKEFFHSIENKRKPLISGEDGLITLKIIDEIKKSSTSKSNKGWI